MKRRGKLALSEFTTHANICEKKATMYATFSVGQPNIINRTSACLRHPTQGGLKAIMKVLCCNASK